MTVYAAGRAIASSLTCDISGDAEDAYAYDDDEFFGCQVELLSSNETSEFSVRSIPVVGPYFANPAYGMVFVVGPTFAAALLSFAKDSLLKIRAFGPTVLWFFLGQVAERARACRYCSS